MPPKSKLSKTEWVTCANCECVFSNRDQSTHNDFCGIKDPSSSWPHGYIKDQVLYALPVPEGKSDKNAKDFKPPDNVHVMCHPGTMQLCGMHIGGKVVVCNSKVCSVWPNPSLSPAAVQLSSDLSSVLRDEDKSRTHIGIRNLPVPHLQAVKLKLCSSEMKQFMRTEEFNFFFKKYFAKTFLKNGDILKMNFYAQPCEVTVRNIEGPAPDNVISNDECIERLSDKLKGLSLDTTFYEICMETEVLLEDLSETNCDEKSVSTLEDVGGLSKEITMLQELIGLLLHSKSSTGMKATVGLPKGVLLYGPSGTGKTTLAHAICQWSGVNVISVTASNIWSKYYGETEGKVAQLFHEAKERAPSIVFLDELDALCGKRQNSNNEVERRVLSSLLTSMDMLLSSTSQVLLLAATSRPDDIDPALRRPGRLDREIEIGVPSVKSRQEILRAQLRNVDHNLSEQDIEVVASQAHGHVGADLTAVCREAAVHAAKSSTNGNIIVTVADMSYGLKSVKPSAMREIALEVPQVSWSDIGGQKDLRHKLQQAIEWPLKYPEAFTRLGIRPPRGLLMYGPPGCSKTMIAKALAHDSGINFIAIKGPELFSKWVGESERAVREVFRKARAAAPAIVFFDEIDALASSRGSHGSGGGEVSDRVLAQLLTEIDGVDTLNDVTIVAATNRPDRIDKALLRPGRLDRIVYVPLPDEETRREILALQMKKIPAADDVDIEQLVQMSQGYSGAEVTAVCHEAALAAMQEDIHISNVHRRHFEKALSSVVPQITKELIKFYEDYSSDSRLSV